MLINAVVSQNLELVAMLLSRSDLGLSSELEVALSEARTSKLIRLAEVIYCCSELVNLDSLTWLSIYLQTLEPIQQIRTTLAFVMQQVEATWK